MKIAKELHSQKLRELGVHNNRPSSETLPLLDYQFVMNEPFIGGIDSMKQSSYENLHFKRKLNFSDQPVTAEELRAMKESKSEMQVREEKSAEWSKLADEVLENGAN